SALGDREGARLELSCARETFERLGAAPDIAVVESLESTLADSARQGTGAEHRLTDREVQVLRLVASGLTNKAIAREIVLSEKPVDRHLSNIFVKANVSSRAAATAFAYEHELV